MPLIEFHIHTKAGSADSSITVDALGEYAARHGVGGIVVAEHFRVWTDWEREGFFDRWGVRVYRAIEATTDAGHIIIIGATPGLSPTRVSADLLREARAKGWFSILAHPFRYYFAEIHPSQRPPFPEGLTPAALAESRVFEAVDAIEVANGQCTDVENGLASSVTRMTGLPATTGSDAHALNELGRQRLLTPAIPTDEAELTDLIRSWRATSVPMEHPPEGD
jgi:predicted metal-dependent phosphoesterase TrpH